MLQIKQQYKGLVITRNLFNIGNVTLDTNTVEQHNYKNFYDIGFDEFFEDVAHTGDVPKYYTNVVNEPVLKLKEKLNDEFNEEFAINYPKVKTKRKKKDGK